MPGVRGADGDMTWAGSGVLQPHVANQVVYNMNGSAYVCIQGNSNLCRTRSQYDPMDSHGPEGRYRNWSTGWCNCRCN